MYHAFPLLAVFFSLTWPVSAAQASEPAGAPRASEQTGAAQASEPFGAAQAASDNANAASPSGTPEALVTARLIAGQSVARPGEPLPVGVALTIAPGWHIYWLHPGDAGISTDVRWKAGSSLRVEGPRWPAPTRFDQFDGAIQALGYGGQVVLPATVTVTDPRASRLELSAVVSWLACHDDCVKGSATVRLELPVQAGASAGQSPAPGTASAPPPSPESAQIAAFEARVPRPLTHQDPFEIDVGAPASAAPGGKASLTVEVRPRDPARPARLEALYVNAHPGQVVGHEQRESEQRLRIDLQIDADNPPEAGQRLAEGVAQIKVGGPEGETVRNVQLQFPTVLKKRAK